MNDELRTSLLFIVHRSAFIISSRVPCATGLAPISIEVALVGSVRFNGTKKTMAPSPAALYCSPRHRGIFSSAALAARFIQTAGRIPSIGNTRSQSVSRLDAIDALGRPFYHHKGDDCERRFGVRRRRFHESRSGARELFTERLR